MHYIDDCVLKTQSHKGREEIYFSVFFASESSSFVYHKGMNMLRKMVRVLFLNKNMSVIKSCCLQLCFYSFGMTPSVWSSKLRWQVPFPLDLTCPKTAQARASLGGQQSVQERTSPAVQSQLSSWLYHLHTRSLGQHVSPGFIV